MAWELSFGFFVGFMKRWFYNRVYESLTEESLGNFFGGSSYESGHEFGAILAFLALESASSVCRIEDFCCLVFGGHRESEYR